MAIPKIMHKEEEVLLSTGLLEFPLSPLTLQEMVLLDRPSSPSDCLIPACEHWSLAPFIGPSSPKPELSLPVPANPPVELGSDIPPTHEVPENIAPKSLALINPDWESLTKVKEVNAPSIIKFKSYEKEELDPSTGTMIRTRVIYPVVILRDKENSCISVPPLSETKGQVNSLMPCPLAARPACIDGVSSTTTTPRGLPAPRVDQVKPAPDTPTRDIATHNGAASPLRLTPTTPRRPPSPMPCMPSVSPGQITLGSLRSMVPPLLQSQAKSPVNAQQSPAPSWMSPSNLSLSSSHCSLTDEGVEEEEGQFNDTKEGETRELLKPHPSEQLLPPSPSPSPSPSSSSSRVDQMVQRILCTKHPTSGASTRSASPDAVVAIAMSSPEAPKCSPGQDLDDASPLDAPVQRDSPSALGISSPSDMKPMEPTPLKYTQLSLNAG